MQLGRLPTRLAGLSNLDDGSWHVKNVSNTNHFFGGPTSSKFSPRVPSGGAAAPSSWDQRVVLSGVAKNRFVCAPMTDLGSLVASFDTGEETGTLPLTGVFRMALVHAVREPGCS